MAQFLQGIGRQVPHVEVSEFEKSYKELVQRTQLVVNSLSSLELRAVQLNTKELIELYYGTYNYEIAAREQLGETEKITTGSMIEKEKEAPASPAGEPALAADGQNQKENNKQELSSK